MAGKGTRMAKYFEGPKQLLPVNGKPVLEHTLERLPDEVTDLIFIVGGPHEQTIRNHFASGEAHGRPITFVVQKEQLGLAHAFGCAREHITGPWIGMVADDLFGPNDVTALMPHELAILGYRVEHPEKFGVLVTDSEGYLTRAVEKPREFVSDLVWPGVMKMDQSFFDVEVAPSARGEYETPDVWTKLIKEKGKKIKVVEAEFWLPINDKEQLERAEEVLRKETLDNNT